MKNLSILVIAILIGCAGAPRVAAKKPWFTAPTDLLQKAESLEKHTLKLIDRGGQLCYRGYLPFSKEDNYIDSHDMADSPAWHGYLMMAYAFKGAVTGTNVDKIIGFLAEGLKNHFLVTGIPGQLSRCYIIDYVGPRRSWMETQEQRPTKYWMQNKRNEWFRNGVAKDHWNHAMIGCAIPLILHRDNEITLSHTTVEMLEYVVKSMADRLVQGDLRILDWDGSFTEFGDLRPGISFSPNWPDIGLLPNGFNRVVVLNAFRTAGSFDTSFMNLYESAAPLWGGGIGLSMEVTGEVVSALGHWNTDKPSYGDMQGYALASMSLLLQEDRREIIKDLSRGMEGLWKFMKYERNPIFTFIYTALVRKNEGIGRIDPIIEDLRDFPDVDFKKRMVGVKKATNKVQPLANRAINSNYWKSSPYVHVDGPQTVLKHPTTEDDYVYAGMDYMLAYWMGRYFNLVPER